MDLSNYTIEELIKLKNKIQNEIYFYKDGYEYICEVRSYGRNWVNRDIKNRHSLEEFISEYNGEDGIVDVYSTNPDLCGISNYGSLMYIESVEDYDKWHKHEKLKYLIEKLENSLNEWENRDNLPFNQRPSYSPIYSREELEEYYIKLNECDVDYVPPRSYVKHEDDSLDDE